ncbi:hypothetical protein LOK49_LG02G00858 [Camellia lanceoleosa]|uniref:Uncharacterized protein n=1 Tax=Camellia lanceoleosa TaxID=1840588 RepID=A0ACC0IR09_9ERIC|nr:hypothetical protein LOK49_LG02G00858 [Camellia lanceoleosa]
MGHVNESPRTSSSLSFLSHLFKPFNSPLSLFSLYHCSGHVRRRSIVTTTRRSDHHHSSSVVASAFISREKERRASCLLGLVSALEEGIGRRGCRHWKKGLVSALVGTSCWVCYRVCRGWEGKNRG